MDRQATITYLLGQWSAGMEAAAAELVPRTGRELCRIAYAMPISWSTIGRDGRRAKAGLGGVLADAEQR